MNMLDNSIKHNEMQDIEEGDELGYIKESLNRAHKTLALKIGREEFEEIMRKTRVS